MKTLPTALHTAQKKTAWKPVVSATIRYDVIPAWQKLTDTSTSVNSKRFSAIHDDTDQLYLAWNDGGTIKAARFDHTIVTNWPPSWTTVSPAYSAAVTDGAIAVAQSSAGDYLLYFAEIDGTHYLTSWSGTTALTYTTADDTLHSAGAGETIDAIGADGNYICYAVNTGSSYKLYMEQYDTNTNTWTALASTGSTTKQCNGLDILNLDDGTILVMFNHQTNDDVQRIDARIFTISGSSWGRATTIFANYTEEAQDLAYPTLAHAPDDEDGTAHLFVSFLRVDRRSGSTVNRPFWSRAATAAPTLWRQPWPLIPDEHTVPPQFTYTAAATYLYLVTPTQIWRATAETTAPALPIVAYELEERPPGAWLGEGGSRLTLTVDHSSFVNANDDSLPSPADEITLTRGLGANTIDAGTYTVTRVERVAVGRSAARAVIHCRGPWFWTDQETDTRLRYLSQTAETIFKDLAYRATGRSASVDSSSVWSQTLAEFLVRRNERYRLALLRLAQAVGARLRVQETGALEGVAAANTGADYSYGPGEHVLWRDSRVTTGLHPTVYEVRGADGTIGLSPSWDRILDGYGGMLISHEDASLTTAALVASRATQQETNDRRPSRAGLLIAGPNAAIELYDWLDVSSTYLTTPDESGFYSVHAYTEHYDTRNRGRWEQRISLEDVPQGYTGAFRFDLSHLDTAAYLSS